MSELSIDAMLISIIIAMSASTISVGLGTNPEIAILPMAVAMIVVGAAAKMQMQDDPIEDADAADSPTATDGGVRLDKPEDESEQVEDDETGLVDSVRQRVADGLDPSDDADADGESEQHEDDKQDRNSDTEDDLAETGYNDLKSIASDMGLDMGPSPSKDELIDAIRDARR